MAVPPESDAPGIDFQVLASYLEALANPSRLELLHILREPRFVSDIRLRPGDPREQRPTRTISSQGVRKHLAKLQAAGFLHGQRVHTGGGLAEQHVVNHQMLFALLEELRRVIRVQPSVMLPAAATMTAREGGGKPRAGGARLIVVHGPFEGRTFPLDPRTLGQDRGWVLGRRAGLPVCLDYDPFLSQEHCEVLPAGDGFELLDLRSNKNGTELNWERLPRGGRARLETGDLVGAGRSLLLFRSS